MSDLKAGESNTRRFVVPLPLRVLNPRGVFLPSEEPLIPLSSLVGASVAGLDGQPQRLETVHPDLRDTQGVLWRHLDRVSTAVTSTGQRSLLLFSGLSLPFAEVLSLPLISERAGEAEGRPFTLILGRMIARNLARGITEVSLEDQSWLAVKQV